MPPTKTKSGIESQKGFPSGERARKVPQNAGSKPLPLEIMSSNGLHTWCSDRTLRRKTELRLKAVSEPDFKGHLKSVHCLICHNDGCLTRDRPSVKH